MSSPGSMAKEMPFESSYLAVVAVHDAAQRTPHTGLALGDLEGFDEVFDNDVGHGAMCRVYISSCLLDGYPGECVLVCGIFFGVDVSRKMCFCMKIACPIRT